MNYAKHERRVMSDDDALTAIITCLIIIIAICAFMFGLMTAASDTQAIRAERTVTLPGDYINGQFVVRSTDQ